jgi:tmRNA-binding protein
MNRPSKQDPNNVVIASNRKARHDYAVLDEVEAGIASRSGSHQ